MDWDAPILDYRTGAETNQQEDWVDVPDSEATETAN